MHNTQEPLLVALSKVRAALRHHQRTGLLQLAEAVDAGDDHLPAATSRRRTLQLLTLQQRYSR